jgi:pre-mRNA-splicing helicase BRR2
MSGKTGRPDYSGYNYGAISSLVLTTDKSALPRRDKEPDGAPTSLSGRIDPKEMGSRVQRQVPQDLNKKKKKVSVKADSASMKRRANFEGGYADIIEATRDVEGLTYRPHSAEMREVYELILSSVHTALGDQAQDIVRSAADTVLEILKNERKKDFDKKKDVEDILGHISSEQFSQLVNLSKKVTDYNPDDETKADPDEDRKEGQIDEEGGVAVVIDEEEQEEEEEEDYEIRESDEEEEEEDKEDQEYVEGEAPEEAIVIGGGASRKSKFEEERDIISPHSVDGFWVQRLISEIYPDPLTAAAKAASVFSILESDSSARDCENRLIELLDFESYDIISKFLKNRDIVVWCMHKTGAQQCRRKSQS